MAIQPQKNLYCKRFFRKLRRRTKIYCRDTTLHGFHYITCAHSYKKSIIWTVICTISLIFCCYLIYVQLQRYQNNRVTTTITTTSYPIWKIPFPAVTICNYNIVYKDHAEEIKHLIMNHNVPENDVNDFLQNLSSLVLVNNLNMDLADWESYQKIINILENVDLNTDQLMKKLAQPCSEMLKICIWKDIEMPCEQLFLQIKTTSGFCCSFNYKGVTTKNDLPFDDHTQGVGPNFGLKVIMNIEEHQYMSTIKPNYGLHVAIHESGDYPDLLVKSNNINSRNQLAIALQPKIITSEDSIRGLSYRQRKCLFENERKMLWSKKYSFSSCMSECRASAIYSLCGCIPFYYPIRDYRFCTMMDSICLRRTEGIYNNLKIINQYTNADKEKNLEKNTINCDCLLECNEITYNYQVEKSRNKIGLGENVNDSILTVFFSNIGCTKFTRSIYLTWDNLLASVGGIFGLCVGGSILSIIEIIYHFIADDFPETPNNTINNSVVNNSGIKLYVSELYPNTFARKRYMGGLAAKKTSYDYFKK